MAKKPDPEHRSLYVGTCLSRSNCCWMGLPPAGLVRTKPADFPSSAPLLSSRTYCSSESSTPFRELAVLSHWTKQNEENGTSYKPMYRSKQCFGSIIIESGSGQKSGAKLFLTTILNFFYYFIIIRLSHQNKSIKR